MAKVRSRDTRPEMIVRRAAHALGYRYRLHVRALPGCPDMVFPARRAVVFVHGCFWHRHACAMGDRTPKSRAKFWRNKLEGNRLRDRRHHRKLRSAGWRVMVVWECDALRDIDRVVRRLQRFLG
jgi:DNA mismatch endonuclease (patch repair protein)